MNAGKISQIILSRMRFQGSRSFPLASVSVLSLLSYVRIFQSLFRTRELDLLLECSKQRLSQFAIQIPCELLSDLDPCHTDIPSYRTRHRLFRRRNTSPEMTGPRTAPEKASRRAGRANLAKSLTSVAVPFSR